jgi:nucleoside-triphosphatase THEP1
MTIIILTGAPGVGKTTIVRDVAQKLKEGEIREDGVVSREKRENVRFPIICNNMPFRYLISNC